MPVSIVVGGQFGSEGKGKVTLELVRRMQPSEVTVIRVGGPNSGHTGYSTSGKKYALRQLPAGCIDRNVDVVFPAGSYLDVDLLFTEIRQLNYPISRVFISPFTNLITDDQRRWEAQGNLVNSIGSTGSGVGASVLASVARGATNFDLSAIHAQDDPRLNNFIVDTTDLVRTKLEKSERVIIEGSQGYGLSLLDGGFWPKATSRNTTASAALAEAGLSPIDVDKIYLVIRSFPIRVAGDSGPLRNEIQWSDIASRNGKLGDIAEFTTVTKKLRRVGEFDATIVRRAISSNNPTDIVLNHLDYISTESFGCSKHLDFIRYVEEAIGKSITFAGFSPFCMREVVRRNA